MRISLLIAATAALIPTSVEAESLSLGSKHWAPTVISKTGAGTANAKAEARVTRQSIEAWCANWAPDDRNCVRHELDNPDTKLTYRASANCPAGRITAVDGNTYTLAGRWDHSDIGGGRTRWRDAAGRIVGRDNASGGLGIAQQWEVLCPDTAAVPRSGGTAARPPQAPPKAPPKVASPPPAPPSVAGANYVVGEIVFARYGPAWVRGRVTRISRVTGARGPELAYNVSLDNGEKGVLPAHMMRKAPNR